MTGEKEQKFANNVYSLNTCIFSLQLFTQCMQGQGMFFIQQSSPIIVCFISYFVFFFQPHKANPLIDDSDARDN